jgi:hypothetical protein
MWLDADVNRHDAFDVDRFRIKIWYKQPDATEIVVSDNGFGADEYDGNTAMEIEGGSNVIHKGKK